MSTRIHAIQTKSVQDFLYFDIGHWDFANFAVKEINSIKKLPISNFNSLQITFLTSQEGEDFCIRNIEFGKIKLKKF
jgi:penicillin-binding protein-related factor A (putative recombinase)